MEVGGKQTFKAEEGRRVAPQRDPFRRAIHFPSKSIEGDAASQGFGPSIHIRAILRKSGELESRAIQRFTADAARHEECRNAPRRWLSLENIGFWTFGLTGVPGSDQEGGLRDATERMVRRRASRGKMVTFDASLDPPL